MKRIHGGELPDREQLKWVVLAIILAALTFTFDLYMPLGVAGGMPYVVLVLLGAWLPKRRYIFILATVGTVLTILGYFLSPAGGISWVVLTNRGLALFAIWITAFLNVSTLATNFELSGECRLRLLNGASHTTL